MSTQLHWANSLQSSPSSVVRSQLLFVSSVARSNFCFHLTQREQRTTDDGQRTTDCFQVILASFDHHTWKRDCFADHFLRHKLRRADKDAQRLGARAQVAATRRDRKSTRLNSSHANTSYAAFC